jgi:hypothetical protein
VLREDGNLEAMPAGGGNGWSMTSTVEDGSYGVRVRAVALGPGVDPAPFRTDDGREVTATVQDGWALAWWPYPVDDATGRRRLVGSTGRLDFVSPGPSPR